MEISEKHFGVILAGGKGRRLWPCSREEKPKQFIDFFGTGRTLLQQAYDRMLRLIPRENIFVSTQMEYAHWVHEQLPELPNDNVLAEPVARNTAPSVAWAAYRISHICPDAQVIMMPSDQAVFGDEAFENDVRGCLDFVANRNCLIAMGVKPTRPEPGYGYIQMGDSSGLANLYRVQSFSEKPDREFARIFMESEEFLWNTGIFVSNVRNLVASLRRILPVVLRLIDKEDMVISLSQELTFIKENFSKFPNLSMDNGVLEQSRNVYVMKCSFGWADLGTWHSIYESLQNGDGDNVVVDSNVLLEDCRDNIIKMPKGHLAVINGLEGYIVVESDDVLLICKKGDSSALIRKYVNEVRLKYGEEFV
ncbi:MAG: mannose-1-phosphate guanylyltransferase [Paludibacteraceae bacterium]|nr:mannose-1-phosphate guanylyltransferase [Paludibacteraceae bacterium]